MKTTRCEQSGVESQTVRMPDETTTEQLVERIRALSSDPGLDGILLQHPVPAGIEERAAFEAIVPSKDVDGVTMHSFAAMAFGYPGFASCTPGGMVRLLDAYGVEPRGKHVVVVGRSAILGKPFGMLMLARNATVTYCHSQTEDLPSIVATGDIVAAAVGRPELIKGDWLKPGCVVLRRWLQRGQRWRCGVRSGPRTSGNDHPVPGGVGPMTIAVLLEQTVDAAIGEV